METCFLKSPRLPFGPCRLAGLTVGSWIESMVWTLLQHSERPEAVGLPIPWRQTRQQPLLYEFLDPIIKRVGYLPQCLKYLDSVPAHNAHRMSNYAPGRAFWQL